MKKFTFTKNLADLKKRNIIEKLTEIRTRHKHKSLNSKISIGEYTYGNPKIIEYGTGSELSIGKFCSIAQDVTILLGGSHTTGWGTTFPFTTMLRVKNNPAAEKPQPAQTTIGNDVWIGYGTLILSGVKIGDGAIIGARTVVSKDIEPYSIVAGNPPKLLKYRYTEKIIKVLLEKKWWDLPEEKIEDILPLLLQPDIDKLLKEL